MLYLLLVLAFQGEAPDYTSKEYISGQLKEIYTSEVNSIVGELETTKDKTLAKSLRDTYRHYTSTPMAVFAKRTYSINKWQAGAIGNMPVSTGKVTRVGPNEIVLDIIGDTHFIIIEKIDTKNIATGDVFKLDVMVVCTGVKDAVGFKSLRAFYIIPEAYKEAFKARVAEVVSQNNQKTQVMIDTAKAKAKEDAKIKEAVEYEDKANELLKHAKRWLAEGDKELAKKRLQDLLKRFPNSKASPEAKKLMEGLK